MHVLIVDDHPLFIKGVQALLVELDASVATTGARSIEEALAIVDRTEVDMVLLDLKLPGLSELQALQRLKPALPSAPVVVVSANSDREAIWQAVRIGAAGYIPKDTEQEGMIDALKCVLARGVYLPPHAFREDGGDTGTTRAANGTAPDFSERQMGVLHGLLQGKSNKVIARALGIAEGTVKAHLSAIYQALGVNSRLQAMSRAHELNLVDRFKNPQN
jgi:DNA-binding NarL/FixJ family response regulator